MFKLTRKYDKPVLEPIGEGWESRAVLNPAAYFDGKQVHLYYRAVEGDNYSTIGYARFDPAGNLVYRHPEPVLKMELPEEAHGVEDPRIIQFEDTFYMFYTAYDGVNTKVGIAVTEDFVNFRKLGLIKLNAMDKDAFIFPERVNGKVVYVHRIDPDVQYAAFDSVEDLLEYSEEDWDKYISELDKHTVMKPELEWESMKIGGGVPPMKTDAGWLFLYHGVEKLNEKNDRIYRAGAILLDSEQPDKVIRRLPYPILEPEREWELIGDVNNVVFPTGAYVHEGNLYVYYGCADKVIGLAYGRLSQLLESFTG